VGGDIIQNKKTFLLLKAFDLPGDAQKKDLLRCTNEKEFCEEEKIEAVTTIYKALKVKTYAEKLKLEYMDKAFYHLNNLKIPFENKEPFKVLANYLMNRIK
jgi:geranylgeranyl diphosphate synthase type II